MHRLVLPALFAAAALNACYWSAATRESLAPRASIGLVDSVVSSPADVRFVLRNVGRSELGFNACSQILQRLEDGKWARVRALPYNDTPGLEAICVTSLGVLAEGDSAIVGSTLPPALQPGVYRILFNDVPSGMTGAIDYPPTASPPFRVR